MSILTYKIKHERNFSLELAKAVQVAEFIIANPECKTTKDVKQFGLKACIANQIIRKYGRNQKIKKVSSVNLTINGYFVNVDKENRIISIPALKLKLNYKFPNDFLKVNQVEINKEYVFVSCEVEDEQEIKYDNYLGVDRNTTGHCAVVANPKTGKVYKFGKKAFHIHRKYKKIRARLQIKKAKKALSRIAHREHNLITNLNHQISSEIVRLAKANNCGIKLENLKGIRKKKRNGKKKNKNGESFQSSLNSWEYYQLQEMIIYKAKILGVPVEYVDPHFTSQECSRCGHIGTRNGKSFKCSHCGHVDHADSNASFVISMRPAIEEKSNTTSCGQSGADRDAPEGSTDTPELVIEAQE